MYYFDGYTEIKFNDLDEFVEYYQGNICDMSLSLHNGWRLAMTNCITNKFKVDELSESIDESTYKMCAKHYNTAVNHTANISAYVPKDKKLLFKRLAKRLPEIKSFDEFEMEARRLAREFPRLFCGYAGTSLGIPE